MKDCDRDDLAFHLFKIMNHERWLPPSSLATPPDSAWLYYVENGWHQGYLRLADEIISKGYKP